MRDTSGRVLSTHDNISSALRANREIVGPSQAYRGDEPMTLPKGHVFVRNPETIGARRIRNWKCHRRYAPRVWQDPAGAQCLARAVLR